MPVIHRGLQGLLLLLCGAASALGFAPFAWWPVWLVAVAWLLHALPQAPWHRQLWMGWVFGVGAALATTHWIGIALWHQPGIPKGVGLGAAAIAWLYSAWPWGLLGMLGGAWTRWDRSGCPNQKRPVLAAAVVLAWWSQAWWLGGFPWLVPGTVWLDTPVQGWGPLGGGLLMAALGLGLAVALAAGWQALETYRHGHRADAWRIWGGVVLAWSTILGGGACLQGLAWTQTTGQPVRVGVVQVDMPSTTLPTVAQEHAYQRMAWRITDALIQRHDVEVIVWPEGLLPSPEGPLREWLAQHEAILGQHALAIGAVIQTDAPAAAGQAASAHNSVLAYGLGSSGRYDKRELVPMTERWPDNGPWKVLGAWANSQPWLQAGAAMQPPLVLAGQQVGVSICYEDAFPHIYQGLPASVGWLINASNDGWFARTPVMAEQHLALSRLRALEQRKPLVRAANIGPSAVISAWGKIITQTGTGKPQMLHADVQPRQGHTPYARWGHAWLGAMVLLVVAGLAHQAWQARQSRRLRVQAASA
jgi:apolipoprotein N-acyltransferase